jgi:ABC-2 type transport system ATP-binding protein
MWEFLSEINQQEGVTIILTTHYLEEAEQLCKRIAIIDKGRIVQDTEMKTLLSQLNFETFVLDLTEAQSTTIKLERPGVSYKWLDEQTLELTIQKGTTLNQALEPLNKANIQLASMRNKTNRLEELFMHLVERNLQQESTS